MDGRDCEREITEIEAFLEQWIRGEADPEAGLQRLASVLAEDFRIVASTGQILRRDELLAYMEDQRGRDSHTTRWVENVRADHARGGVAVAVFDEWQIRDGRSIGNLVSAVFGEAPDSPNGVRWLHIHETTLDRR